MKRIAVIINKEAGALADGKGREALAHIASAFTNRGIQADIQVVPGAQIAELARRAVKEGVDAVVVGGGDGTINSVASVVTGTGVPMGVLPMGTLNHFAKDLSLPADLEKAACLIAEGTPRPVDVGEVNGRIFVNNSSIGTYPGIVKERDLQRERFGRPKWLATLLAGIKTIFQRHYVHVKIDLENESSYRRTPFVFVGNNVYSLDFFSGELRPRLDAGQLCVLSAKSEGVWAWLRMLWHAVRHRLKESTELDSWCARAVRIYTSKKEVPVSVDGEVIRLKSPLNYRIRPGELQVIAP